ncbi:hypothetical protein N5J77_29970 [Sphingobium yanoikuyae]|uniref:Uncharacterized protein n=1 Tax=Sphingobium yanoikuyae TaxID=13690 RepID=A0AA42X4N4_SPHYA|nr:hypothetical protein [Sphingobium yanoikuyae]MDH2135349.1 hypothetical protein [Sphingobium yanoikuyae]MDH2153639.1 hypothetical protein [Sphingobium yanoikuyae]MDH2170780.1 hypothetical protein [Sphingobium yanoikuyae]
MSDIVNISPLTRHLFVAEPYFTLGVTREMQRRAVTAACGRELRRDAILREWAGEDGFHG